MNKINFNESEIGDVFSEQSHYILESKSADSAKFKHVESGNTVTLSKKYIEELLSSGDQFYKEIKVGKEDKFWTKKQLSENVDSSLAGVKEGDLKQEGIRTIWNNIHSSVVFAVSFSKAPNELSSKKLKEKREEQLTKALDKISKAKTAKKGVEAAAREAILEIQQNPVLPIEKGEERILRGYKIQFESNNGYYDVVDMDLIGKEGGSVRKVNINQINWLVLEGVKYIVE